jgi:hypothetical protein
MIHPDRHTSNIISIIETNGIKMPKPVPFVSQFCDRRHLAKKKKKRVEFAIGKKIPKKIPM